MRFYKISRGLRDDLTKNGKKIGRYGVTYFGTS